MNVLYATLILWAAWVLANLAAMALVRPDMPCFNGFRIHIPSALLDRLTILEYLAIYAHECGHRKHRHVWKNFALVCFFIRPSRERRWRQELEADDYAAKCIDPAAMASALRKLSYAVEDNVRARRLETLAFINTPFEWEALNEL